MTTRTTADELTGEVLEETPEKATRFLTGMARSATLRQLVADRITDALLAEGRELLLATINIPRTTLPPDPEQDPRVQKRRKAQTELNNSDEELLAEIDGI